MHHDHLKTYVPRWTSLCVALCAALIVWNPAHAKQADVATLHGVAPSATVGSGPGRLRPVVHDPVTGAPWALRPYRATVFRHGTGGAVLDIEGQTDAAGHTAYLQVSSGTQAGDVLAAPVIGEGSHEAKAQLVQRSGKPKPDQGYVMYFSNGAVFTGISDAGGNTAVVRMPQDGGVSLKLRYPPLKGAWQRQAKLLNATVTASDAAARWAIYQRVLDAHAALPRDADVLPLTALADGMLTVAAQVGPEALEDAATRYLDIKAARAGTANADGAGEPAGQRRVMAYLDLLDRLVALPGVPPRLIGTSTSGLLKELASLPASGRPRERILDIARGLAAADSEPAAFQLFDGAKLLDGIDPSRATSAEILAFAALEASVQGRPRRSQQWMSDANVVALLADDSADATSGADALAFYRQRVPAPPAGMVVIDDDTLDPARSLCIEGAEHAPGVFNVVDHGADANDGLHDLAVMKAMDALLSHGTLAPGNYKVESVNCGGDDHGVATVAMRQSVIDGMRGAHQLLAQALYFGSLQGHPASSSAVTGGPATTGSAPVPTALEVRAFLQHAKVPPGTFPINKLRDAASLMSGVHF